ncbi:MAG: TIGR00266 family protein [Ketobacter sp.]|nr:TIGR00266 family protein [Ketobacter sp.]
MANIDEQKAEAIFDRGNVTIKKGVDEQTAAKFQKALEQIGAIAVIDPPLPGSEAPLSFDEPVAVEESTPPPAAPALHQAATALEQTNPKGYPFTIEGRPDYAFLTVKVPANETLKVEASSMATMDTHMKMKTKLRGGFGRFLSGESIFINEFTAEGGPGEIGIAPGSPGDMTHLYLDNNIVYLQNSAFVASTMGVEIESKWQGLTKGFFSGESLFLIRASGSGDLWFNTYGTLIEIDVEEDYVVDTGNIVAFTDGLDYTITKVGGYKSLFFSGEGFVCRFKGQGKVWIQTRGVAAFAWWAHWFRPVEKSNG